MRNIVSPLDGFASPFGRRGLSKYAIGNFDPALVADFDDEYYRANRQKTTFDGLLTHSRLSNATMVDSDGLIKWGPHNLALNSASPATQSITVISGADYTVECTGVSIVLSGAGTGTVTEGNPVEITASTTTLTLTVTGSTGTMWCYRSDLGGMVNNPDTGNSYVPTTSSAVYLPRRGHHVYNGSAWVNEGLLIETESRTNLLHTTNALVTQILTVTAVPHTLHFTGTGTVTLSGASTDGPLVGTGTGEQNRVSLTFTPTAGLLTLTVTGTVADAQLEVGSTPSSYIPNLAVSGSVNRTPDILTIPSANLPWPTPKVIGPELVTNGDFATNDLTGWTVTTNGQTVDASTGVLQIISDGTFCNAQKTILTTNKVYLVNFDVTINSGGAAFAFGGSDIVFYSSGQKQLIVKAAGSIFEIKRSGACNFTVDNISVREIDPLSVSIQMDGQVTGDTYTTARWYLDANNYITQEINSSDFTFEQAASGTVDAVTGGSFTSGVNTPFNFASTHASTLVAAAVGGTALTDNTTPVALPNLSATDLNVGHAFMGTLKLMRVWSTNITEAGREEAST